MRKDFTRFIELTATTVELPDPRLPIRGSDLNDFERGYDQWQQRNNKIIEPIDK